MTNLTFDPFIPLALWVPLALAAGVLLAWYAAASRRRVSAARWPMMMGLMTLVVVVPLVILLNPTWLERIPPPAGKPLVTVLVDRTASMATKDLPGGKSRYQEACRLALEASRALGERYEVRVRTFAEMSAQVAPDKLAAQAPDGASTDLAAAIDEALDPDRPQGQSIVVLSDGGHNAGGGAARLAESVGKAKAMAAPVYVRTLGTATVVRDLEVSLRTPQELAFVGQPVPVTVTLRQRGSLARHAELALVRDGKVLEHRQVEIKPDDAVETLFQVSQPAAGVYRYEIRADRLPEEVTDLNNTATLLLRVLDQPVRVLLLEGKPYWDTKFLIRTLSADPSVELVSIVAMAEGRLMERKIGRAPPGDGKTPAARSDEWSILKDAAQVLADAEKLAPYQIVVLGRDAEVFLSDQALANLKKWLNEREGSLVCFRGPPASQISQRLGELMPVRWTPAGESRFRVHWTPVGQSLRWLPSGDEEALAGLPSLATSAKVERVGPLAEILATSAAGKEGQAAPAITYQPVGSGRVVVIEGAGMWRWAFLAPQYQRKDDPYGTLWRSLLRWMVANVGLLPGQQLALRTDKVTFSTTEAASATLLLRQPAGSQVPQIELTGDTLREPKRFVPLPSGNDPGQFRVAFGRLGEGRYWARVVGENGGGKAGAKGQGKASGAPGGAAKGDGKASDAAEGDRPPFAARKSGQSPGLGQSPDVAAFDVRGNLAERLEVRAQPDVMRMLARQSGGAEIASGDVASLAAQFDRHLSQTRPERIARSIAWDRWWVLFGTMTVWAAAWGLRRWSGLV